ncbi:MAG TPA: cupin domain-containing protein [Pyrinomonadaceae bacterium]|nr:cupin domain-containing protein [Pyrinomonadaceae bacterium]
MKIKLALVAGVVLGIAIGIVSDRLVSAQGNDQTGTLLTVDLAGTPGKEARVWIRDIAPGERTPTHYHPGDVIGYVLQGAVLHTVQGKSPVTYSAGQAFSEHETDIHFGTNQSPTTPVKLLTIQITDKGTLETVNVK